MSMNSCLIGGKPCLLGLNRSAGGLGPRRGESRRTLGGSNRPGAVLREHPRPARSRRLDWLAQHLSQGGLARNGAVHYVSHWRPAAHLNVFNIKMTTGLSPFQAAATVIGLLVCLGGPALWWVFYRMDTNPRQPLQGDSLPTAAMTPSEVREVEAALGLSLPGAYVRFLSSGISSIDGVSALRTVALIVDATMMYRKGEIGIPAWPSHFICIGDEADACPYALNCITGEVIHTRKGYLDEKPIARFQTFDAFVAQFVQS